jgi:hypothetical protein
MRWPIVTVAALATLLGGCSPNPSPSPSTSSSPASSDSPAPRATASSPEGSVAVHVTGTVKGPCAAPPSGCAYWLTLVLPGGEVRRAAIRYESDYGNASSGEAMRITGIGPEIPATLPPGRFALVFEAAEISDVASYVPSSDGTMTSAPPEPFVACTAILETWGTSGDRTVRVTFHGYDCTVKVTP